MIQREGEFVKACRRHLIVTTGCSSPRVWQRCFDVLTKNRRTSIIRYPTLSLSPRTFGSEKLYNFFLIVELSVKTCNMSLFLSHSWGGVQGVTTSRCREKLLLEIHLILSCFEDKASKMNHGLASFLNTLKREISMIHQCSSNFFHHLCFQVLSCSPGETWC